MSSISAGYRRKMFGKERAEKQWRSVRRLARTPLTLKLPLQNSEADPSKLLVNVTIDKCLGAVQIVMSAENSVADLIKAALAFYVKDKRRPFLTNTNPNRYNLHYSSFSLQSLKTDDKLIKLGSRNFFLCAKPPAKSCSFQKENMEFHSAFHSMLFLPLLL